MSKDFIAQFEDALRKLNIEDFRDRIFNSNSHGELLHLQDYCIITDAWCDEDLSWFRAWFLKVVKQAEENWDRPESVFQHILKILRNTL